MENDDDLLDMQVDMEEEPRGRFTEEDLDMRDSNQMPHPARRDIDGSDLGRRSTQVIAFGGGIVFANKQLCGHRKCKRHTTSGVAEVCESVGRKEFHSRQRAQEKTLHFICLSPLRYPSKV